MSFTRKNVWELGSDWAEPILWYGRAVKSMKARAFTDKKSWRFWAATHGIDKKKWERVGYWKKGDPVDFSPYWKQCQHGSWFFLPWHRGYVLAFEAVVRADVVRLGGDPQWALPYWNYFKTGQDKLPPAFSSPNWPDGNGDNPLYVPERYGPNNDGKVFVELSEVNLGMLCTNANRVCLAV
ncbi:tyrosinase family protein [Cupriavidus sp. WKF15]|uniref:tyrosinase family protein n=1 Tax=Cupriavidus sp. WKF15 TaxID=3032282 RepID=UPI0023E1CB23|nr:tyrosinase family protein [Cupriavidus sp. WKF15]WER50526.1 tyrosinase family protein [Cupriavidus sp. WKF15]